MKVALGQIKVIPGNPTANFLTMKQFIEEATLKGADLIVFPEMCISGYLLQDRWLDDDWCRYINSFNELVKGLSTNIGIIWGNLFYDGLNEIKVGRDGRPVRFNTAFFAYKNKWVKHENGLFDGIHVKHLNPDYRFFDDSRYFFSALEVMRYHDEITSPFLSPFLFIKDGITHRIGLEVCEDLWSDDYSFDVTDEILKNNVELIINISSSPWTLLKEKARERHIANKAKVPLIYVNAVSLQNIGKSVLTFDGDSSVFLRGGIKLCECNDSFRQELLITDLIAQNLSSSSNNKLFDALIFAIKEFDEQIFNKKVPWIIGLSGGIDSSVSAALLVLALGKERVIGYNLPSKFNSSITISNATNLAKALDIKLKEYSISPLIKDTEEILEKDLGQDVSTATKENIHARIRGHLLSSFAQAHGGVICNNGNKLEIALGYCTLYGDTIGALSPLGDLTKLQIADIALEINKVFKKEVIPTNLMPNLKGSSPISWTVPPTAELKENQIDPMKWGYHDFLINYLMTFPTRHIEDFMEKYLNRLLDNDVEKWIQYYKLDNGNAFIDDLEWFMKNLQLGVYKRIQMPPIVVISRGAFGYDYRESQLNFETTKKYLELKEKIKNMK